MAAGQCLEDSRGCIFSSYVPHCDSSKHMKCKSKFLLRELDKQEEQQAYSSCSLQQSFERKYTFNVGRAGMQLSRLECRSHNIFCARAYKMIVFEATVYYSMPAAFLSYTLANWKHRAGQTVALVVDLTGDILEMVRFWAGKVQGLLVASPRRRCQSLAFVFDKGGYTLATHEQGYPFIQGESILSLRLINDFENE